MISQVAGAAIADIRGRAVKFDENGRIVLAGAGEAALGVGIMTNDETILSGQDVDIQIKDIGMVYAGGAVAKGAQLAADANGAFVAASGSDAVIAIALDAAGAAGVFIQAFLK